MLNVSNLFRKNTEIKELISDTLLTHNCCDHYKNSCVLFTVERKSPAFHLKYVIITLITVILLYVVNISKTFLSIFLILLFLNHLLKFSYTVRKESVYLLVPVGLQLDTKFLLGTRNSTFIPWSIIQDFLIIEVITRQTVIYCLVVLVKDINGERYVTIFNNIKPKLKVLEKVYRNLQTILISQKKRNSHPC